MKKHDEDLWDFRSDPVFGDKNNKKSGTAAKADTDEQQADEYRNILKSASDSSSLDDIDNMTFVMKDGQASFIETPAAKPESTEQTDASKEQVSEEQTPEDETPEVQTPEVQTPEEEPTKNEETEITTPVAEPIKNEEPEVTPAKKDAYKDVELFKTPAATKKKEEKTTPTAKAETKVEVVAESDTQATSEANTTPQEETAKTPEDTPEEKKTETSETEEFPAPAETAAEETPEDTSATAENTDSSDESANNKFSGDYAVPKDILEGPGKRAGSTKKVPATDDDFILAKPHSKKKSHHSHSHSHHHHSEHSHSADSSLPSESVDDYVFAHYRKQSGHHHHHHSHSSGKSDYTHTKENVDTTVVCSTSSPHYRSKKSRAPKNRKWKSRPWWQKLLIILAWALGILAVLSGIAIILFFIFSRIGINDATDYEGVQIVPPSYVQVEDNGTVHIYKGKKYVLNTDIANILCIGVDKQDIYSTYDYDGYEPLSENGQADALFMVALNTKTGKTTVLSIPRDTMADINIYNKDGEFIETNNLQICQSYAYGDGQETSCLNTVESVQRLFYQLPIQTYFAMDLSAIAPLNDTVGGIRVTLKEDFYDSNLALHPKGKTMILYGDHARKYLQYREVHKDASSIDRLGRQTEYLKLFTNRTLYMTKKDITTPISLYNIVSENSITNMDVYRISGFARCLMENGVTDLEFKTIPGNSQKSEKTDEKGERYNEYHVDEEKFYELFLETYFIPVD